ncbi:hypothetical protein [Streptomyces sp. CB01249]|uniref:hypothetical protein n=1 Tax=Streptomyces sp. CB01249 TaxID=1703929 RepID=UPI001F52ACCA|nr:hypothetical protein [Streptomyces sp. CB01249]
MTAERGRVLHRAVGSDVNHSWDGGVSQDLAPLPPGVGAGPAPRAGGRDAALDLGEFAPAGPVLRVIPGGRENRPGSAG